MPFINRVRNMHLGLFFSVAFVFSMAAQSVLAHDIGHRWYSSSVVLANSGTNYRAAITSTAADYDMNTELVVSRNDSTSALGVVYYMQGYYGASYDPAWAIEYRDSLPCNGFYGGGATGNCNTTDKKANLGYVYFNLSHQGIVDRYALAISKHELGHVLGMAHGGCAEVSIMRTGECAQIFDFLQPHDMNLMNWWY